MVLGSAIIRERLWTEEFLPEQVPWAYPAL